MSKSKSQQSMPTFVPPLRRGAWATIVEPRIGVTPAGNDNMGAVLDRLHFKYETVDLAPDRFADSLSRCNVLFANCSAVALDDSMKKALREFIARRGALLATDWAYPFVEALDVPGLAFSDQTGEAQEVVADIIDTDFASLLKRSTVGITFDLPLWVHAKSLPKGARPLFQAKIRHDGFLGFMAPSSEIPLAISFEHGGGMICYSSFHNSAQSDELEKQLFTLLTLVPIASTMGRTVPQIAQIKGLTQK